MCSVKKGTTLIELLIYVGLLSLLATGLFGLVLQINRYNHALLGKHTQANTVQIALDLMMRDIRDSKMIDSVKTQLFNLTCRSELGTVKWKLNEEQVLLRIDHQTKLKKPAMSKVAENIAKIAILPAKRKLASSQIERGKLVYIKFTTTEKKDFKRAVLLRQTLLL